MGECLKTLWSRPRKQRNGKELLKQLIVKAGGVAAIRVIGLGLSLVSSIAIARLLGAEVLGAYAFCLALLSLAAVPISQGWGIVVLRHISDQGKLDQQWHSMIRDGVLISLALSVVAFLVYLMAIENFDSNLAVLLRSIPRPGRPRGWVPVGWPRCAQPPSPRAVGC